MTIRHACSSAVTAGLLTCGVAVFAQTSGQAQSVNDLGEEGGPITIVGCLQREPDYRRQEGTGGVRAGMGNEYILVNTTIGSLPSVPEATCTTTNTGAAVELTGGRERRLDKSLVGHWVEVSGMLKKAKLEGAVGTSGSVTPRPTGGFDPFGHDLKLREVNVESFRVVPVSAPLAARAAPEPAIEPEPAPPQPVTPEQPAATTGVQAQVQPEQLPHTASALPLTGTIGLIAFAGALALRAFGRWRVVGRG
jgi:hypothetical protein